MDEIFLEKCPFCGGEAYMCGEEVTEFVKGKWAPASRKENRMNEEVKDCRTCKYGYADDHWGIPMCHNPEDCQDWNLWEPKEDK